MNFNLDTTAGTEIDIKQIDLTNKPNMPVSNCAMLVFTVVLCCAQIRLRTLEKHTQRGMRYIVLNKYVFR